MKLDSKPIRPEVLAALSQTPEIADQCRAVAQAIRDDAKSLAPKVSGRLARSIQIERDFDAESNSVQYLVGWNDKGFYGLLVELGTEDEGARPHLVPAAIKNGAVAPRGGGD